MARLPDLEGLSIFAKVAECRSFTNAALELRLSKATVSKAISRIESRLGAQLIIRTARRFELTDAGRQLVARATHILAEGEAAEDFTRAQARAPRGLVRLSAPMSFGTLRVAPLLPGFLKAFPEISLDLHLNDAITETQTSDASDGAPLHHLQPCLAQRRLALQKGQQIREHATLGSAAREQWRCDDARADCGHWPRCTTGIFRPGSDRA